MLPQLQPEPIRPELEREDYQKEIWHPRWKCHFCRDKGIGATVLVLIVIPDYNHIRDKPVACKNPACKEVAPSSFNQNYDQRFSAEMCLELDRIDREVWDRTVENKFLNFKALSESLRIPGSTRTRTANDEREIQQRKEEIEVTTHQQWIEMSNSYSGGNLYG